MTTKEPLNALTTSRRAALQMAFAAAVAARAASGNVAAQDASTSTWNWAGNAGHTGELPGPGLDLGGAIGELWRIPEEEFSSYRGYYAGVNGYLDGVVYTMNGESLYARSLSDGELLWAQSPATLGVLPSQEVSPLASPQADVDEFADFGLIGIANNTLLMTVNNGRLLGLAAQTGSLRWDLGHDEDFLFGPGLYPTVVENVLYCDIAGGVAAVELSEPPVIRWSVQVDGPHGYAGVLGVEDGYIYVLGDDEIRALAVEDGSEYWRTSLDFSHLSPLIGVYQGNIFMRSANEELVAVDQDGQVAWSVSNDGYNSSYGWILDETITRMTPTQSVYDYCRFQSLHTETGIPIWDMEVNVARWPQTLSSPLLCDGKAYALIYDAERQEDLLVIADPTNIETFGTWGSHAVPLFMADGVLIAQDRESNEIIAIGNVPAILRPGGRATVTEDVTLRGAPSSTAIERSQVTTGTLVDVTGDNEITSGTEWVPVTVHDMSESGWLPAPVLAGRDGSIRFSPIDLSEFGQFTSYP